MNIIQAIEDPNLFRPFLTGDGDDLASWQPWMAALRVLYGLPLCEGDHDVIQRCTGRDPDKLPAEGFATALFLTGRRSGKSRTAAVIGAFEAVLAGHESKLAKGERGIVLITAPSKSQGRIVRDYVRAVFDAPILNAEIARETPEGFELNNGTRIEIAAGDFRTIRGFTLMCGVVDECAFFGYDTDSKVKSDSELIRAIKPSLATVGGRLIAISSPYAQKGWCYSQWKRYHGNDSGSVLVWNCPSRTMNATLPQRIVDEALAEDYAAAKAEYLGEFRDDVATFLPRDLIEALVVKDRTELAPVSSRRYGAFVDLSGGRVDDAALAIAHLNERTVVLDLIRRWTPPFSPDRVIAGMVALLHSYGIGRVVGDNYSAEFVKSAFELRGIRYARATSDVWSNNALARTAKPKSQLYLELLPRLCSGEIELLDNDMLVNQLAGLERRTRSGGRDAIDHAPGQHDDLANVVAGVADCVHQRRVIVGSFPSERGLSPMEQAIRETDRRAAEFARMQVDDQDADEKYEARQWGLFFRAMARSQQG
ncbi:MAG: hypothetical protein SH850_05445 [Planctomycetaceae bacterium]|nr:hypothetical protein [Planctomycetaceae bacterium]